MDIRTVEPRTCRDDVVDLFWQHRHWPGASRDDYLRLWDHRYGALSDGEPLVWVAHDNGRILGHIALFQRRFRIGNVELRAAVSGDLLVRRDQRHPLLGLKLVAILRRLVQEGRLDFVYTFPNLISYRLALKDGWRDLGAVCDHVDLRSAAPVIRRRTRSEWVGRAFGRAADAAWALRRRFHQRSIRDAAARFHVDVHGAVAPTEFDRHHWHYRPDRLVGADTAEYLVRRFLNDPYTQRRLFALRDPQRGLLEGYVIVEFRAGRAAVCDCRVNAAVLDEATAIALVAHHLPRDLEVFSVRTLSTTRLASELRTLGFLTRAPRDPFAQGSRLIALWNPRHPLASELRRVEAWNVYPIGAADS